MIHFLLIGLLVSIALNLIQWLMPYAPRPPADDRRIRLLAQLDAQRLQRQLRSLPPEPETPERLEELRRRLG
jgi:hypothetical protein